MPALWWTNIAGVGTTQHPSSHYWLITNPTCLFLYMQVNCERIQFGFIFVTMIYFCKQALVFDITEIEVSTKLSGYRALVVRASSQEVLGLQHFASFALDDSGTRLSIGPRRGSVRAQAPRALSR